MALLWQRRVGERHYEIRTAGKARRLYTNGVFHTQYHPERFLTNNVWDCLSLPSLFLSQAQLRRVLVLGVGGGAVIQQINRLFPRAQFVGVELDAMHLSIARRFFACQRANIKLVHADAITWIKRYSGPKFDLIIEDLFTEQDGQPQRVMSATPGWFKTLGRALSPHGMLVMNFISQQELQRCGFFQDSKISRQFCQAYRCATPVYENVAGIFLRQAANMNQWHTALQGIPAVDKEYQRVAHRYQWRRLSSHR